jgi:hypothetical protein
MPSRDGLTTEAQGTAADQGTPDTCGESARSEAIANAGQIPALLQSQIRDRLHFAGWRRK